MTTISTKYGDVKVNDRGIVQTAGYENSDFWCHWFELPEFMAVEIASVALRSMYR